MSLSQPRAVPLMHSCLSNALQPGQCNCCECKRNWPQQRVQCLQSPLLSVPCFICPTDEAWCCSLCSQHCGVLSGVLPTCPAHGTGFRVCTPQIKPYSASQCSWHAVPCAFCTRPDVPDEGQRDPGQEALTEPEHRVWQLCVCSLWHGARQCKAEQAACKTQGQWLK